jgi:hypothetical protein
VIFANADIPMLILALPGMVLALPIVIGVEAAVLRRDLNVSRRVALRVSSLANAASTLVGVPLTWAALLALEMFVGVAYSRLLPDSGEPHTLVGKALLLVLQAPWIGPSESDAHWMLPAACLVLLVPFFGASYVTERIVALRILRTQDPTLIGQSVARANVLTYSGFAIVVTAWLLRNLVHGPA